MLRGEFLCLHYLDSAASVPRLGLVLPKRLARHAVVRNLIRRQARECFRARSDRLPVFDMVFRLAQPAAALGSDKNAHKQRFKEEISVLLDRIVAAARL